MEREACVCDHGYERSDLCAEIIIIIYVEYFVCDSASEFGAMGSTSFLGVFVP